MERIIYDNDVFINYEYTLEQEFEKHVIKHAQEIFGAKAVYIDIKKKIGAENIVTIPDGYLLDFSFEHNPRLYIIENELSTHDPYKHIGQQLLKFSYSYKESKREIKSFLLTQIISDPRKKEIVENGFQKANYRNIDAFLEDIIFEKPVAAIIIIDRNSKELENVLSQLTMKTDIIEFQAFTPVHSEERQDNKSGRLLFKYTPFQPEIRSITESPIPGLDIEDLDTVVVPANKDGFDEVFLKENRWYAIRISSAMLDRLHYIAAYQTAPVSAITHYAEILKTEKYEDTGKYVLYFRGKAAPIGPLSLLPKPTGKVKAPQAPRYTSFKKLLVAKTLDDVF